MGIIHWGYFPLPMETKTIIVNAISLLSQLTGIGKYIHETCRILHADAQEYDWHYYYGFASRKIISSSQEQSVFLDNTLLALAKKICASYALKKTVRRVCGYANYLGKKYYLYWEPNFIPLNCIRSRYTVTSIHDFSFHVHQQWHPLERTEFFNRYFWKNIRRSDLIVTDSYDVKRQIEQNLAIDPAMIQVVYPGINHQVFQRYPPEPLAEFRQQYRLPQRFLLFVGTIGERKNTFGLIRAYQSLSQAIKKEYKLVLIGCLERPLLQKQFSELVAADDNIFYLGYLTDIELAYAYNLATLFVFPSHYEGFGIPPLEAMACGTPVLVSDIPVFREVYQNSAHYVSLDEIGALGDAIVQMLEQDSRRRELIAAGEIRAGAFSWQQTAQEILQIFRRF